MLTVPCRHVKALESRSQLLDAALASADEANRRWEDCRQLVDQLRIENAALRTLISQLQASNPHPLPPPPQVIVQDPNPELVQKLEEAQAEIERLRSLIASRPEPTDPSAAPTSVTGASEMRHRRHRAPMSDDGSETYDARSEYDGRTEVGSYVGSEIAPPDGVPLQVVIIIALGVFVTTYLFF